MKIPVHVQISFWIQLALLIPGVIRLVPRAFGAESATVASAPIAVVALLVGIALWVWIAIRIRQGRRGFRMFLTVATGLNVVFAIVDLVTGIYGFGWTTFATAIIQIGAVVLLWLPESRRYFDAVRQARREAQLLEEAEPVKPYLDPDNR